MSRDDMGGRDIEAALRNGYFQNSRARVADTESSDPYHKSHYPPEDVLFVARKANLSIPRPVNWTARFPPPPSVEDESDALAKEAGPIISSASSVSEEPSHRGDPDQYPIILPVHEYNPERRFVLVQNQSDTPPDATGAERKFGRRESTERLAEPDPEPDFYEANTARKYVPTVSLEERTGLKDEKDSRQEREKRRSRHEDLPRIITDTNTQERTGDSRRVKSSTRIGDRGGDRSSGQSASARQGRETLLTPEVTEHATHGRDRSYHRGPSTSSSHDRNKSAHPDDQYSGSSGTDHRYKDRKSRSAHPPNPSPQKRQASGKPDSPRRYSNQSHESSRRSGGTSPRRPARTAPSTTPSQSDHDSSPQRTSAPREKGPPVPPPHRDVFYSSEDEPRARRPEHRRRKSGVQTNRAEHVNTPTEAREPERRKPRGPAPLPPVGLSHTSTPDPYSGSSSSRSATFPKELKLPHGDDLAEKALARASPARGTSNATRGGIPPAAIAAAISAGSSFGSSGDYRRAPAPPGPRPNPATEPRALPPTPIAPASAVMPAQPIWPPPRIETDPSTALMTSYRRYSMDQQQHHHQDGPLPDIPACPRTRQEAGHMDWLTLPRCDNFNICPSCYSANFSNTEFAHNFVPVPFRARDRPLACDFGTSEYYRIAWLFTRKYRRPDLGLLHALARVAAPCCSGHGGTIWYGVRDPRTARAVDNFTVCHACAKTIETLLPGLTGIFVPLDPSMGPTNGVCALATANPSTGVNGGATALSTITDQDRMRFLMYFDVLEGSADRALETQTPPNIQVLADRVRELSIAPPCPQGHPVRNALWHTMRSVPGLTVCPECFVTVVRPILDDRDRDRGRGRERDLVVAGDFHAQPTTLPDGDCMLFSDHMRSVFARAVRERDLRFLASKVRERAAKERECNARLHALERQRQGTGGGPAWDNEMERVLREWKKYE
ncbi:hypothetical protein F5Y17DRAFT_420386 [Xylariaceae sp. FL0594]|nr:hypothetical protein F5Y17DRAFT_420386 [Xylariaceae sp. FL0594]